MHGEKMRERSRDVMLARFSNVMEIAERMKAKCLHWDKVSFEDGEHMFEMFTDPINAYAEPGYSSKFVLVSNWNEPDFYDNTTKTRQPLLPEHPKLFARLVRIFEKMGWETEWSDEWISCEYCGKLVRTEPDSYSWKPSFVYNESACGLICKGCAEEEEVEKTMNFSDLTTKNLQQLLRIREICNKRGWKFFLNKDESCLSYGDSIRPPSEVKQNSISQTYSDGDHIFTPLLWKAIVENNKTEEARLMNVEEKELEPGTREWFDAVIQYAHDCIESLENEMNGTNKD